MTDDQIPMTNEESDPRPTEDRPPRKFDLAERTAKFGETVIRFSRGIKLDAVSSPIVRQLIRAGTSVGANYCEADEAGTKQEFRYRISVCQREARETKYWLRMIAVSVESARDKARLLWKEADELNRIFAAISRSAGKAT